MARAKQTGRSEARRRYRQSTAPVGADGEGDILEPEDDEAERRAAKTVSARPSDSRAPSGRVGFGAAFRLAYHPPHIAEDIRTLPSTLRSRGFLAAIVMVIAGGLLWYFYPVYSGSITAWELLVLPGSALAPQLVAGFFAPRASYLLGLLRRAGPAGRVPPRQLEPSRPGGVHRARRGRPGGHLRGSRAGVPQLDRHGLAVRGDGGVVPAVPGPVEPARRGPARGREQVGVEVVVEAHRKPLSRAGACRRGPSAERRSGSPGRRPVPRRS